MGVVIPADFGLLSFHTITELDPEEMIWTVGLDLTAANDPSLIPGVAATSWGDNLADQTSSIVTLTTVALKVGPTATGPTFVVNPGLVGTEGSQLPPPNCAVLAQKHTSIGGRHGRGRAYLPGISAISPSLDSAGNFGAVAAGLVQTSLTSMQEELDTDVVAGPAGMVLLHSDATAPTILTNWTVSRKLATQRRRLRP